MLSGKIITFDKVVIFLLIDICLSSIRYYSTGANIIKIVQILRRIIFYRSVCINGINSINRLPFQPHIIVISGIGYGKFCFCIHKTSAHSFRKRFTFFINTCQACPCPFAIIVELAIVRHSLAQSHQHNMAYELFYLIISCR